MAWTSIQDLKDRLAALFGEDNTSARAVQAKVGQLAERVVQWDWPITRNGSAGGATAARHYDTGSLSLSQPRAAVPCFSAARRCKIKEIRFAQAVSSTVTNTASTSWTLLVAKKGGSRASTATSTYSLTTFIAGLTSDSGKHPTGTGSNSSLTTNVAGAPNRCHLNSTPSKLQMEAGDMLQVRVAKGAAANDAGASFKGGRLTIVVEDN